MKDVNLSMFDRRKIDGFSEKRVVNLSFNEEGMLTAVYSDGTTKELGVLLPPSARNLTDATVNEDGELICTFDNGETTSLGYMASIFEGTLPDLPGEGILSTEGKFKPISVLGGTAQQLEGSIQLTANRIDQSVIIPGTVNPHDDLTLHLNADTPGVVSLPSVVGDQILPWNDNLEGSFTLPSGTWSIDLEVFVGTVGETYLELRNATTDEVLLKSNSLDNYNMSGRYTPLVLSGMFHIEAETQLRVVQYCEFAIEDGLGKYGLDEDSVNVPLRTLYLSKLSDVPLSGQVDLTVPQEGVIPQLFIDYLNWVDSQEVTGVTVDNDWMTETTDVNVGYVFKVTNLIYILPSNKPDCLIYNLTDGSTKYIDLGFVPQLASQSDTTINILSNGAMYAINGETVTRQNVAQGEPMVHVLPEFPVAEITNSNIDIVFDYGVHVTVSGEYYSGRYSLAKALDRTAIDLSDGFIWDESAGEKWYQIEYPEAVLIAGFDYAEFRDDYTVRNGEVQVSMDGETWTTVHSINSSTVTGRNQRITPTMAKFIRLVELDGGKTGIGTFNVLVTKGQLADAEMSDFHKEVMARDHYIHLDTDFLENAVLSESGDSVLSHDGTNLRLTNFVNGTVQNSTDITGDVPDYSVGYLTNANFKYVLALGDWWAAIYGDTAALFKNDSAVPTYVELESFSSRLIRTSTGLKYLSSESMPEGVLLPNTYPEIGGFKVSAMNQLAASYRPELAVTYEARTTYGWLTVGGTPTKEAPVWYLAEHDDEFIANAVYLRSGSTRNTHYQDIRMEGRLTTGEWVELGSWQGLNSPEVTLRFPGGDFRGTAVRAWFYYHTGYSYMSTANFKILRDYQPVSRDILPNLVSTESDMSITGTEGRTGSELANLTVLGYTATEEYHADYTDSATIEIDLAGNFNITGYEIVSNSTSSSQPTDWTVEGFDGTDWVTLDTVTGAAVMAPATKHSVSTTPGMYSKLRMVITASSVEGEVCLGRFSVMSDTVPASKPLKIVDIPLDDSEFIDYDTGFNSPYVPMMPDDINFKIPQDIASEDVADMVVTSNVNHVTVHYLRYLFNSTYSAERQEQFVAEDKTLPLEIIMDFKGNSLSFDKWYIRKYWQDQYYMVEDFHLDVDYGDGEWVTVSTVTNNRHFGYDYLEFDTTVGVVINAKRLRLVVTKTDYLKAALSGFKVELSQKAIDSIGYPYGSIVKGLETNAVEERVIDYPVPTTDAMVVDHEGKYSIDGMFLLDGTSITTRQAALGDSYSISGNNIINWSNDQFENVMLYGETGGEILDIGERPEYWSGTSNYVYSDVVRHKSGNHFLVPDTLSGFMIYNETLDTLERVVNSDTGNTNGMYRTAIALDDCALLWSASANLEVLKVNPVKTAYQRLLSDYKYQGQDTYEIIRKMASPTDIATNVTITSSRPAYNASYAIENMISESQNNGYLSSAKSYHDAEFIFELELPTNFNTLEIRNGYADAYNADSYVISVSNDGISYSEVADITLSDTSIWTVSRHDVTVEGEVKFVKIVAVNTVGDYVCVGGIDFLTTEASNPDERLYVTEKLTLEDAKHVPRDAFNFEVASITCNNENIQYGADYILKGTDVRRADQCLVVIDTAMSIDVEFETAAIVKELVLWRADSLMPLEVTLQASDDLETWTDLGTWEPVSNGNWEICLDTVVTNTTAYKHYRLTTNGTEHTTHSAIYRMALITEADVRTSRTLDANAVQPIDGAGQYKVMAADGSWFTWRSDSKNIIRTYKDGKMVLYSLGATSHYDGFYDFVTNALYVRVAGEGKNGWLVVSEESFDYVNKAPVVPNGILYYAHMLDGKVLANAGSNASMVIQPELLYSDPVNIKNALNGSHDLSAGVVGPDGKYYFCNWSDPLPVATLDFKTLESNGLEGTDSNGDVFKNVTMTANGELLFWPYYAVKDSVSVRYMKISFEGVSSVPEEILNSPIYRK